MYEISNEKIDNVSNDIINLFSKNKKYITKKECNDVLNVVYESLFEKKLNKSNFELIFKSLNVNNNNKLYIDDIKALAVAMIVSFDVMYLKNINNSKDVICIKVKNLLPVKYYVKKNCSIN